jgi:hypothetical protein
VASTALIRAQLARQLMVTQRREGQLGRIMALKAATTIQRFTRGWITRARRMRDACNSAELLDVCVEVDDAPKHTPNASSSSNHIISRRWTTSTTMTETTVTTTTTTKMTMTIETATSALHMNQLSERLPPMPSRGHIQVPLETVPSRLGRHSRPSWEPMFDEGAVYDGEWRPHDQNQKLSPTRDPRPSDKMEHARCTSLDAHAHASVSPAASHPAPALVCGILDETISRGQVSQLPLLQSMSNLGSTLYSSISAHVLFGTPLAGSTTPLAGSTNSTVAVEPAPTLPKVASLASLASREGAEGVVGIRGTTGLNTLPQRSNVPRIDGVPNELCLKCFGVPCSCP